MPKLATTPEDLLSAIDAGKILGVSADMVRHLARDGRLPPAAQTVRGVRLFRRSEVERLASERAGSAPPHHAVQFYDTPESLSGFLASFVAVALRARAPVVVIARESSRFSFCERGEVMGVDVKGARESGQLMLYDAGETLASFMVGGMPEPERFRDRIGEIVRKASAQRPRVRLRIYGEMVDVLWRDGHRDAAVRLEQLWNDLARDHSFALLCAYDMAGFRRAAHEEQFKAICSAHTQVAPVETQPRGGQAVDLLREMARLQQRARALENEIELRDRVEDELRGARDVLAAVGRELCDPRADIADLRKLGSELVALVHLARGEVALRRHRLDIAELIERARDATAPLLAERGQRLEAEVPPGLAVAVDADRMAVVVSTLLSRAARRSDPGSPIQLEARQEADSVRTSVRDAGDGAAGLAAEGARGAVALAAARETVQLHGGSLTAQPGGRAAVAEMVLPLSAALQPVDQRSDRPAAPSGAQPPADTDRTETSGPSRRILVVDDNEDFASLLAELLRELGHEVELALDADSALAMAATFAPTVALLDIGLPDKDGYELASELRELRGGDIRLIAITGYAQEADRRRSEETGFSGHLTKPVNPDQLAELIRSS